MGVAIDRALQERAKIHGLYIRQRDGEDCYLVGGRESGHFIAGPGVEAITHHLDQLDGGEGTKPINKPLSWRDFLTVHPAADLFPRMSEGELRELGENIKAHGLMSSIVLYQGTLLDGRSRLDAMELVGIPLDWSDITKLGSAILRLDERDGRVDPYDFVVSANLHRRHLTLEQKRDLIAKLLKAKPEQSNVTVATQAKVDDKTVAKVRRELEATSEIPRLEKTVGADGKERKLRAKRAPEPKQSVTHHRATESPEVSIEQRGREHHRLDRVDGADTAADGGNIVDRALALVQAMTNSERRRFFAEYQKRFPKTMSGTNAAD
jgi:hypothetical protein